MWRRIPRELKANLLRYAALFFLIVLGTYTVVGLVGAADTIITTVQNQAENNKREDGQFTTLVPFTPTQLNEIKKTGITLEPQFYLDFKQEDTSTIRVFKNRTVINLFAADSGNNILSDNDILVEKLYADSRHLQVGSPFNIGSVSLTIAGIGTTPDYDCVLREFSNVAADKNQFGTAFVSDEMYNKLLASGKSIAGEQYVYAYLLNGALTHEEFKERIKTYTLSKEDITEPFLLERIEEIEEPKKELLDGIAKLVDGGATLEEALASLSDNGKAMLEDIQFSGIASGAQAPLQAYVGGVAQAEKGAQELQDGLLEMQQQATTMADELFDYKIENVTSFLQADNNPRIAASVNDIKITKTAGILAGIIAVALFAYVIATFVLGTIEQESQIIGTLFAMGMPKNSLLRHYLVLPVLITLLGGIVGTLLGFSPLGIAYQIQDTAAYFSFPNPQPVYPIYLLLYGIVMPPVIALIVNYLVIKGRLNRPPLRLLRKEIASTKNSGVKLQRLSFISMFRLRQILREKRASLVVMGGLFLSLLLLMLGVNCFSMLRTMETQNKSDILFETMTILKYPPKIVPHNTHAAYLKSLKGEKLGYELDVSLLGLEKGNPFFSFTPAAGQETLTISSSVANKFGLKTGDMFYLWDDVAEKHIVFKVDRIVQYSPGLYVFMDIDSLREMEGTEDKTFNVLFSEGEPTIDPGRIYSVTQKSEVVEYAGVFMDIMTPMIIMLLSVSVIIFAIVLYLMLKMMVDRSSTGISLMKVFGYNGKEVRKLYLDAHFFTVAIAAIVGVPLAKICIDKVYPLLVANISFGPDMTLPPAIYFAIFLLIFICYWVISQLLNRRLGKITVNEVLKQRE